MATVTPTITNLRTADDNGHLVVWAALTTTNDTGVASEMWGQADRSVQISGTFGSGGTVVIEGSNDGTNYVTLTDPQGNAISKTSASIEQIEEITRYIRPKVSAGDGTTSITVTMLMRQGYR